MARPRTLVMVLAGGAGGRLELLTAARAKPAVPYAGTHRLIDFPLSNALHSGISDVWVSQQFNPVSLTDHLANGRPWDLDRTTGGLLLLSPRLGGTRSGWQGGTAASLWHNAPLIREHAPDALVVVSADAVYLQDYAELVEGHLDSDADVTMTTTEVDPGDASRYGVAQVDAAGRVTDYAMKPDEPEGNLVTNEVFVFTSKVLLDLLDELGGQDDEQDDLKDLGNAVLPRLVKEGRAREHRFPGYWRDLGTVASYWSAHMELLVEEPPIDLDDPNWPVLTKASARRAPAQISRTASIDSSLVASSARIAGRVEHSVIGRGVVVEEGATVVDSVLLPGAVVRSGATVHCAVLDDGVEVGRGASVGEAGGEVALIGLQAVVQEGAVLRAGARLPEQQDDD